VGRRLICIRICELHGFLEDPFHNPRVTGELVRHAALSEMRSTQEYGERMPWRQMGGLKFEAVLLDKAQVVW